MRPKHCFGFDNVLEGKQICLAKLILERSSPTPGPRVTQHRSILKLERAPKSGTVGSHHTASETLDRR